MKTLQDYIYESILDDEDILIDDVKRSAKDPFGIMYDLYSNKDITSEYIIHNLENMSEYILKWVRGNFPSLSKLKLSVIPDYKETDNNFCKLYVVDKPNSNNAKIDFKKIANRTVLILYYKPKIKQVGLIAYPLNFSSKIHKFTNDKIDYDEIRNDLHNIVLKYNLTPEKDYWDRDKIYDLYKKY
jgi:hypothetical protein